MIQKMMYQCIPATGKKNDSFIGIRANKDLIEVHYPETLCSAGENLEKEEILALIKSISLAKTTYGEITQIYKADNVGNSFVVDSYLWLLDDYINNGVYKNYEKQYVSNARGRVNWKRTLKQVPIVSGANLIYKNLVTEISRQQDSLLTEIYKYCVRVSSSAIGWLIGITADECESIPFNQALYLSALQEELDITFDDNKRRRLSVMKSIVSEISSDNDFEHSFSYGVNDYSYVYERMVDELYGNVSQIQDYYPNGEWDLSCFDKKFKSSNLRPDTVVVAPHSTVILDAKFYRFGTTKEKKDLPNTSSIQKQITYGEYITKIYSPEKVINAFVLPYNKKNNKFNFVSDLECIGFATAKWKNQESSYERVFTLLIDMKYLLMNWQQGSHIHRKKLIDLLNRCLLQDQEQ